MVRRVSGTGPTPRTAGLPRLPRPAAASDEGGMAWSGVEHSTDRDSLFGDYTMRTPDTGRKRRRARRQEGAGAGSSATAAAVRAPSDDGDDDGGDDEATPQCHLCQRPVDAQMCHMLLGLRFHNMG